MRHLLCYFFVALTVLACSPFAHAQAKKGKGAQANARNENVMFVAHPMESEKFQGQLESDHDLFFKEAVFPEQGGRGQFFWELPSEFKGQAVQTFQKETAIPALATLGFVPLSEKEALAVAKNYKGAGEILTLGVDMLFRAKNLESLQKATDKVSLLGSREEGPLNCFPSQLFVGIKFPGSFAFQDGKAKFMVQLSIRLYGVKFYGGNSKKNGAVGLLEATEVSTHGFLDEVRLAMLERRPKELNSKALPSGSNASGAPARPETPLKGDPDPNGLCVAIQKYDGKAGHMVDDRIMVNVEVKLGRTGSLKTGAVEALLPDGVKQLSLNFYEPIPGKPTAMSAFEFQVSKGGHYEIVFRSKDDPTKTDRFSFDLQNP